MTKGTLRAGLELDAVYEMTARTFSAQMETGGFDLLKMATDGRGQRIFCLNY